ncbi:PREDICTED: protein wings apart-like [Nicrophorus vespilloides]|uniref:Protein wings apart-like n=1 Tax=Nicrophorus vespilloides TaxID=110193 RepID=A0ABM1ML96_NICVS|nr:PREDICTED: protein wings apart-like [Nicrophorus vespilloides]XP_017775346.1 PREDICTED: protein wings apart-like [Nicrophorus vespilloides]XP_017775347.1 PREDICTED: protein wings apart-like [Nicrophorus vespilloides]
MSRGYGKYRRGNYHNASFQFDSLFKENSNRPSAARSTGTVGKWGITSFTSIRTINGLSHENEKAAAAPVIQETSVPKPKKFFKSRNSDNPEPQQTYNERSDVSYGNPSKKARVEKSPKSTSKRFFGSKSPNEKAVLTANNKRAEKPPIVLRIYRGKSQLVSDSDESESTPTPSSTPVPSTSTVTSPRALRDSSQKSPSHGRITRSTRRSMQQDPSSSPATADTAIDSFSLFTSPRNDTDLSPQYIPAEKYEVERKAMYDNLLGNFDQSQNVENESPNIDLPPRETTEQMDETTIKDDNELFADDKIYKEKEPGDSSPVHESEFDEEMHIDTFSITNNQEVNEDVDQEQHESEEEQQEEMQDEEVEMMEESIESISKEIHQAPVMDEQPLEEDEEEEEEDEPEEVPAAIEEPASNLNNLEQVEEQTNSASGKLEDEWSTGSDSDEAEVPTMRETRSQKSPNKKPATIEDHKEEILDKILEKPENPVPVKLVISKKKGSIFKSRSLVADSTKKRREKLYKHKWSDDNKDVIQKTGEGTTTSETASASVYDDDECFKDDPLMMVVKEVDDDSSVTSVKCTKSDKGYYTVVRNVKKAHQMQEIGEFQEFNDDVEYILDALQDNNPISTRCLSAITLASKCMAPAFRMHVRAHGTVGKFFKALHDATRDQSLGLCTATVMFVLSQDRLNMDLDRDCLELMLNLLESDVSYQQALDVCGLSTAQLEKNKQKVRELCAEVQSQGQAMHLNLDNITVGQLAMETLLSLTSKRAGEWFKEELRELGGLEHIMKTICECCRQVSDYVVSWTDALLDKLRKVDRCLRVLENVTHNNEENQTYLLKYKNGILLDTLVKLYRLCDSEIPLYPVTDITDKESAGAVIREALLVTLKVLINLTHHFNKQSMGSTLIGERPGIIDASLHLLLQVPHYIPDQKKFELGVLVLMLLINLIQDNDCNKKLLIGAKAPAEFESIFPCDKTAVEALIVQFHQWEECARVAEKRTDAILDGEKDGEAATQPKTNEEFIEETVAKLLQKAGTHMEFTFLASYLVLLLGYLIMDSEENKLIVRKFLKDNNFSVMVELLKKFFNFMNLTASTEASSVCAIKATEKVIKFLEDCDKPPEPQETATTATTYSRECMDLSFSITH